MRQIIDGVSWDIVVPTRDQLKDFLARSDGRFSRMETEFRTTCFWLVTGEVITTNTLEAHPTPVNSEYAACLAFLPTYWDRAFDDIPDFSYRELGGMTLNGVLQPFGTVKDSVNHARVNFVDTPFDKESRIRVIKFKRVFFTDPETPIFGKCSFDLLRKNWLV